MHLGRRRAAFAARPRLHLLRRLVIAAAYRLEGERWKGSGRMRQIVLSGVRWWEARDDRSRTGWWNRIGVPQVLGEFLLLRKQDIIPERTAEGVEILKRSAWLPGAGENAVWSAGNTVLRACLTGDPTLAASA